MRKNLSGIQRRNKEKIAQANRRGAYSSYTDSAVKARFMTPEYTMRKKVHAN